jgi:hypothetical protein
MTPSTGADGILRRAFAHGLTLRLLRRAEVDVVERAWLVAAYWVSGYQDCRL